VELAMKTILKALIVTPLLFISSCTKDGNPVDSGAPSTPGSGNISTGPIVDVATQVIPPSGGTISVIKAGDPLNGFELVVPSNAFVQPQNVTISYSEIKSHQLGANVTPVSPLIKISSNGGYSAEEIKIKVPIKLAPGYFAMGFLYDESSGRLEALPVAKLDSTSIIVTTRRLSSADAQLGKGLFKTSEGPYLNLIISSIVESALRGRGVLSTGFKPGIDDWEFPNRGSYISPGGHCAGQSVSAMWYFYEQKLKGSPGLFKRFDKITDPNKPDSLWCDNPLGYRFASTIQEDMNFDNWIRDIEYETWVPNLVFNTFVYAMILYAEPQLVLIRSSVDYAGHAMIVYAVGTDDGKLYIADPNYPNNRRPDGTAIERVIQFVPGAVTGQFMPYFSPRKVGEVGRSFDQIGYAAKTSHIDWNQIRKRWDEFQRSTIGNDRFPTYDLYELHNPVTVLTDGFICALDSITICSVSTGCAAQYSLTAGWQPIYGYDAAGKLLGTTVTNGSLTLGLKPGDNTFGLHMWGFGADHNGHYLDFKWMRVHRNINLTIASTETNRAPLLTSGLKNKLYTFVARTDRPVPTDGKVKYDWNFGDSPALTSVNNDSTVTHEFAQEGTYTVDVGFYYDLTKISSVTAQATIAAAPPPLITSIDPNASKIGDTVKVKGKYFGTDKTKGSVKFNGIVATEIISWIDTTIAVKVPQGAQTGSVTVTVNSVTSNAYAFTVATVPVPMISGLTPATASVNDTISIDGNNFGTDKTKGTVQFTGTYVSATGVISWTNTKIRVRVPTSVVTGPLSVTVNGIASNQVQFTLQTEPRIDAVYHTGRGNLGYPKRTWGLSGNSLEITGRNFEAVNPGKVLFNTVPAQATLWQSEYVSVAIPPGVSGPVNVSVQTKSGLTSNSKPFFVGAPFDSIKTHPKVRIDFVFYASWRSKLTGQISTISFTCLGLGDVTWGSDGFTANVSNFTWGGNPQTKTGTLKVTLSPDGTKIARVELNYTNLAPSYENVQYVAENIPSRTSVAYATNQLLLEYYVKGYAAVQSLTRQFTASWTPTVTTEPILGLAEGYDSYISIVLWDFDVS
jgi:YD repeat-containing protein